MGKTERYLARFHTQIIYGDFLREIGYALKKLGKIEWQCYSELA